MPRNLHEIVRSWIRLLHRVPLSNVFFSSPFSFSYSKGGGGGRESQRKHGSTRVPGHAFLVWHSSWRTVVYFYYIRAAENSISSQLGSFYQGQWGIRLRAGPTRRPAWLAGGEWPGMCVFVHDGRAIPPAVSVQYRLPWQELPSCELIQFQAASWYNFQLLLYSKCTQPSVISFVTQGRHDLVL